MENMIMRSPAAFESSPIQSLERIRAIWSYILLSLLVMSVCIVAESADSNNIVAPNNVTELTASDDGGAPMPVMISHAVVAQGGLNAFGICLITIGAAVCMIVIGIVMSDTFSVLRKSMEHMMISRPTVFESSPIQSSVRVRALCRYILLLSVLMSICIVAESSVDNDVAAPNNVTDELMASNDGGAPTPVMISHHLLAGGPNAFEICLITIGAAVWIIVIGIVISMFVLQRNRLDPAAPTIENTRAWKEPLTLSQYEDNFRQSVNSQPMHMDKTSYPLPPMSYR